MTKNYTKTTALIFVAEIFHRNGYVRYSAIEDQPARQRKRYKKGDEIRLPTSSDEEMIHLHQCLDILEFKFGKSYAQSVRQMRTPIYGREQVAKFLAMFPR